MSTPDSERPAWQRWIIRHLFLYLAIIAGVTVTVSILAARDEIAVESITDEEVEEFMREYCDGRIFSGRQALEIGFVDHLGTQQDAINALRTELGLGDKVRVVPNRKKPSGLFGPAMKAIGASETKKSLRQMWSQRFTVHEFSLNRVQAVIVGKTGVVTCNLVVRYRIEGFPERTDIHLMTSTYVWEEGRWLLLALGLSYPG